MAAGPSLTLSRQPEAAPPRRERGLDTIAITVDLPSGFPEKYRSALIKAVDRCTVKAHIQRPPQFEIVVRP